MAAAACVIVNVWPATVTVPVRTPPGFAATLNATEPFPVPLAPAMTVTQATLLLAVQVQPLATVTDADTSAPPPGRTAGLVELI